MVPKTRQMSFVELNYSLRTHMCRSSEVFITSTENYEFLKSDWKMFWMFCFFPIIVIFGCRLTYAPALSPAKSQDILILQIILIDMREDQLRNCGP